MAVACNGVFIFLFLWTCNGKALNGHAMARLSWNVKSGQEGCADSRLGDVGPRRLVMVILLLRCLPREGGEICGADVECGMTGRGNVR